MEKIANTLHNGFQAVLDGFTNPISSISNFFVGIGNLISSVFGFLKGLIEFLLYAIRSIFGIFGKVIDYILGSDFFNDLGEVFNMLQVYLGTSAYYFVLLFFVVILLVVFTFIVRLFTLKTNFSKHVK